MKKHFCPTCGNIIVQGNEITVWDYCEDCGTLKRGTSRETAECPNTNCTGRRKNHGIVATAGRHCSCCGKELFVTTNAAYCANEDCERYLREQ